MPVFVKMRVLVTGTVLIPVMRFFPVKDAPGIIARIHVNDFFFDHRLNPLRRGEKTGC